MDILYAAGRATGAEILERLEDQPSYSTVRTILRVLERKGHVRHVEENLRYVYLPTMQAAAARQSALERVVRTFFDGVGQNGGRCVSRSEGFLVIRRRA